MTYGQMEEIAVACPSSSRIDIVGYDTGGDLYWIASNDNGATWGEWVSLGGTVYYGSTFGLVSGSSGTLDLVVVGTSGYVYHNHCTDWSWSGFAQIPGQSQTINSNNLFVGISTCGGGTVDVGWTCADRTVYHNTWHGSYWDGGVNLGGEGYYGAVPLSIDSSSCYIVTSGGAGDCYYRHRSGGTWGDWAQSGSGVDIGSPVWSVTSSYQNIIACFDTSNHLYWAEIGGAWNDGGQGVDSISLASRAANSWMLLINLSSSELPYSDEYNSGTWTGWYGPIKNTTCDDYEVKAAPKGNSIVMAALDTSSRYVYYAIWNGSNWSTAQLVQTATTTSITQSAYTANVNTNVTISGYLRDSASNGLPSQTISLYKNGVWVSNHTTASNGSYSFTVTDSVAHTDNYYVVYIGSGSYAASTSSTVYITYTTGATVTAVKATATATGKAPTVTVPSKVYAVPGTATAVGKAPTILAGATVTAVKATATAVGKTPVITTPTAVYAVAGTATADIPTPIITGGIAASVTAVKATATATGVIPVITATSGGGLHNTHAVIEYSTWPIIGTTVTNSSITGSTGDGILDENRYTVTPSGDYAQVFNDDDSYVTIGDISDIDTLPAFTAEWLFRYNIASQSPAYLFFKSQLFSIYYVLSDPLYLGPINTNRVVIERADADLNSEVWYTEVTLVNGSWYDLQITWGAVGSTPVLKLNDVSKTVLHDVGGALTSATWYDDSSYIATLCNNDTHNKAMWCKLAVFRLHDIELSDEFLTDNYVVDWARTQASATNGVVEAVPGFATANITSPIIIVDYACDAVVATATADAVAPYVFVASVVSAPGDAVAVAPAPIIHLGMGMAITNITVIQDDETEIIGEYMIETVIS